MANHEGRSARGPNVNPTPGQLASAQRATGWPDAKCAELVCVSVSRWQGWLRGEIEMPAGAWKLFRIEAGMMAPSTAYSGAPSGPPYVARLSRQIK